MELDKIPVWAWGLGGVVVLLALMQRNSGGGAVVTTANVGPTDNSYATANLQARVAGFDKLTDFAGDLMQTNAAYNTSLATINAGVATNRDNNATSIATANINAQVEQARIGAAQQTAVTQSANQLAANRSTNKSNTIGNIVGGIVSIGSKLLGFL